jgi:hypothetical protein
MHPEKVIAKKHGGQNKNYSVKFTGFLAINILGVDISEIRVKLPSL